MIITVASFKGGVAKTTTAIHLAALLNEEKPTLLIDGDPNRSASGWSKRGGELPFKIADERLAGRLAGQFENLVFDTKARPEKSDLVALAEGCDLLIIPTTPDAMALEALTLMLDMLSDINVKHFRVLITKVPPPPRPVGRQVREALVEAEIPLFETHVRLYAAFEKAAEQGILVRDVKDRNASECWADYVAVTKEVSR
ncbi:MAG: ParA family protein [Isosphaeraceae bacterium]